MATERRYSLVFCNCKGLIAKYQRGVCSSGSVIASATQHNETVTETSVRCYVIHLLLLDNYHGVQGWRSMWNARGGGEKCVQRRDHVEYLGSYGVILNESLGWDAMECIGFIWSQ